MKAKVRGWVGAGLLTLAVLGSGPVQAAVLVDLGSTVYDPSTGLEWLKDANAAQSLGYDADGQMNLGAAQGWISTLNAGSYLGHQDWRLPLTAQPDASCSSGQGYGWNCTGSELGDLFYNKLGGKADESVHNTTGDTPEQQANLALFTNVQSSVYWSGTPYAPNPYYAWFFNTSNGEQFVEATTTPSFYAWAVRPGEVVATPLPAGLGLLGSALAVLGATRRRR